MVHQYRSNGYNIVLDVDSGSVHIVDDLVYDIIKTAETCEAFANSFDMECAEVFDEQTAEGYDDVVMLLSSKKYMPKDLRDLLTHYNIINKED